MSGLSDILPLPAIPPKLLIYDSVPAGHIAYAVPDRSCEPLARLGEVLVIKDAPRTYPIEDQWFLIQWISKAYNEWERERVGQTIGIPRERDGLWGYYPPCNRAGGLIYCGDFGFSFEQMTDYIRGPVVGIYRPS